MSPVLRWAGLAEEAESAGVLPPTTALSMATSGEGTIRGTYYAYSRFVDQYGLVSNLSPISAALELPTGSGTITGATNATPIVITSAGHGLATGARVTISGVLGNTAANGTFTITQLTANTFSLGGSAGNGAYTSGGSWEVTGVLTITYSGVPLPVETKVRRRQILRNTAGQTATFYVDVDTEDLTSTTFSSTNTDTLLSAQEAVVVVDSNGDSLANLNTVPPNHKPFMAMAQGRMFYAGEVAYTEGNAATTYGSTTVTGVGTEWLPAFVGRFLYVDGATESYEIESVDVVAQTLVLTEPYRGATSGYSFYSIRPAPAERRLVYYSEAGLPQSVPATNAFPLADTGDEITGLLVMKSFVYVLERHHIWRITFEQNPEDDGAIFLAALRGCVNHRSYSVVDDTAYMLDEQGVWAFGGGGDGNSVSTQIQGVFRGDSRSRFRVNWEAQRFFHAILYQPQETIRFFAALSGDYLPRQALCYSYRSQRWWIEELAVPIGASTRGRHGPMAASWRVGGEQVYLGSSARRVLAYWQGQLDGPDGRGTTRGTVTSWTSATLTDVAADYASAGMVGSPVTITGPIANPAKGQTRLITALSGTTLALDRPWSVLPDVSSEYQVGGVAWNYLGAWHHFALDEADNRRTLEVGHDRTDADMTFDVRRYLDGEDEPAEWGVDVQPEQNYGVAARKDNPDLVCSLKRGVSRGYVRQRVDGHSETDMRGQDRVRMELRGVTGPEEVRISKTAMDGVTS